MSYDNFAQGDSGVPTPHVEAWNKIQAKVANELGHPEFSNFADIQLYILTKVLVVATSDHLKVEDKIAAFEVARHTLADYLHHTNHY